MPFGITPSAPAAASETDPLALKIVNNLSDLDDVAEALDNLGLGTAAEEDATDFQSVGVTSTAISAATTNSTTALVATASGVTLTLHNATTAVVKRYTLANASNGDITFATTSSQTVNGSTTGTIIAGQSLDVVPVNGNWIVI
jgi:hypothetical protein